MTCSTSFFNNLARLLLAIFLIAPMPGCGRQTTVPNGINLDFDEDVTSAEDKEISDTLASGRDFLIAVLPMENLSATKAPLQEITASLRTSLTNKGFRLLDSELLEKFRKKYRMRYTGGIGSVLSDAMQEEMGVDAILITSLEAYSEQGPPRISLISRLVSSGRQSEIIWIDSIGLSGDQSPGILDLARIREPETLLQKAVEGLSASLSAHIEQVNHDGSDVRISSSRGLNRKYLPYDYFLSPVAEPEKKQSIAVIPLLNLAVRRNAGTIISLHYVRELFRFTDLKVIEPGLVREHLLRFRAIMPAGPSLAVTDLITSPSSLGVDLVLSGKAFDYQNSSYNPKIDYSVQVLEKESRKVVFGARTFSTGKDGVFFFNFGRVFTAHKLLAEMTRVTVQLLTHPNPPRGKGLLNIFARASTGNGETASYEIETASYTIEAEKNILFR